MKYSVSIRQPDKILEQADEILLEYCDINALYDKIEKFPDKIYNIRISKGLKVNWEELYSLNEQCHILIGVEDVSSIKDKCHNIKYYWAYPITSFYELNGLIDLGVSELYLGGPLYFSLDKVSNYNIPIRLTANLCYEDYIPRENGIYGTYIRPEDIKIYEQYVDTIDFYSNSLTQEATLLQIYKNETWNGNLNLLLTNFNKNIDNRAIDGNFGKRRSICGQKCQINHICHYCDLAINFAKTLDEQKSNWIPQKGFKEKEEMN